MISEHPIPANEVNRLQALLEYNILDSEIEEEFERITELISIICETPISLVTLIDEDRQWFKSKRGLDVVQTARIDSFCQYTIMDQSIMEVGDATQDPRFKNNPYVIGNPKIRFYAGSPLIDPDGHALGSLCVISPEPKKLTSKQKKALEILSKEVVLQIVARKERHELKKAKKEAEEANLLKTILLGNLSHEVRTPLQSILGFSEILETSELNKVDRKKYFSYIRQRAGEMEKIIESLLEMASLETGQIKANPKKINLKEFVNGYYTKFLSENFTGKKEVSFDLQNHLQEEKTDIDEQHLVQVLNNLHYNAIKFSNNGSITLIARPNDTEVELSVQDTGIGISQEKLESIFQPFRQAHEGFSRAKGGIGLGLSICQKLVDLWGGSIRVSSKIDEGSKFTITIPLSTKD